MSVKRRLKLSVTYPETIPRLLDQLPLILSQFILAEFERLFARDLIYCISVAERKFEHIKR